MKSMVLACVVAITAFTSELPYETVMAKVGKEAMVLEIGASTCKACKEMKKTIDTLKKEDASLPVHIIDLRKNKEAAQIFKIQMIPTQVVLNKSGREVYRHIGGVSSETVLQMVELSKKE